MALKKFEWDLSEKVSAEFIPCRITTWSAIVWLFDWITASFLFGFFSILLDILHFYLDCWLGVFGDVIVVVRASLLLVRPRLNVLNSNKNRVLYLFFIQWLPDWPRFIGLLSTLIFDRLLHFFLHLLSIFVHKFVEFLLDGLPHVIC